MAVVAEDQPAICFGSSQCNAVNDKTRKIQEILGQEWACLQ